ncbi:MAG: hypothetical protein A2845_04655 [Candidatus Lloydbacteria bacterium RIFCSPHIGHO2_01_FULL_49_22]|uniref:Hydrogenase maturation protease n=1 Tax=Candidatus Lloydbacteria bacterium RIFCSPHIGHO2_01_FULL_49_22 TaxID=1798658 RepID=A0A1G2CW96_9BACT|nr:MAG: hypothetical protein A2845_04655 [Candidatus Lloydbacteria bacterium RIFCSPHIGHO2_01_FULL_49_22]OGZ10106.1 MAG: hypothetical protein A3C14_00690 [Candidatus Lloydbacteria bacterium RIFCSPHIGHO2_02_FULL_50_18]
MDATPLRIMPRLALRFSDTCFIALDPNEEWDIPDPFVLIDTVVGLSDIHIFRSLDEFGASPTVSMHDFDALFNLRYLAKLGKLKSVLVIGIPPEMSDDDAFAKVVSALIELLRTPTALDEGQRAQ